VRRGVRTMADAHVYDQDAGTVITIATQAPNLSTATLSILWKKPSGETTTVSVTTYDESAQTISWTVTAGFWDEIGIWEGQALVYYGSSQMFYGDVFKIDVRDTLE
ncbi:MAG: hypothetical protein JXB46_00970, partial [Candidatus Eisenbacteria bacterium]|nr:hypothetical protein [Candidatus Eisenbacteria bacterium]